MSGSVTNEAYTNITNIPPNHNPSGNSSQTPQSPRRRVAVITGAAQGIGRGIALRLAQDRYKVVISDLPSQIDKLRDLEREISSITWTPTPGLREHEENSLQRGVRNGNASTNKKDGEVEVSSERELKEERRSALVVLADVSKEEDVKRLVEKCVEEFGGLDVMVANAGIAIYKPLLELSIEEFDQVVAVNLRGATLCYKYAAQQMVKQGRGGRIIAASSMYGKAGAPNLAGYSASKFGIRGLTHTAALEWGKYGITVNSYAPAGIRTPMLEEYDRQKVSSTEGMNEGDFMQGITSRSAVGYLGGPRDVASLVAYLASPEAHFITGQTISVDGGSFVD